MSSWSEFAGLSSQTIRWADGRIEEVACRACGATDRMKHLVTTPNFISGRPEIDFFCCSECGSLNAKALVFNDYDENDGYAERGSFVRHYLQVGAGVDFMIRPLQRTRAQPGLSMIDVGCGFGFAVSYWNWAGGRGFGVEPSLYGRLGSELLDSRIYPVYLADAKELAGHSFDRVFSSEVIEHVDDVGHFLGELKNVVSQSGIIVITTPNADFIQPSHDWGVVLAALSPGAHRLLFSSRALQNLLSQAGFEFVDIQEAGDRLIAYASQLPIPLEKDPESEKRSYLNYLLDTVRVRKDPDLRSGLLFRAFKEQVNLGDLTNAATTFRQLQREIVDSYGVDLTDIYAVLRAVAGVESYEQFGDRIPFFTPPLLFYAAMATLNGEELLPDARESFSASMVLTEIGYQIAPSLFQEAASLYWLAKLHIAIACISVGDHTSARKCLDDMLTAKIASTKSPIALPRDVLLRAQRESGVVALQTGEPESAMRIFRNLITHAPGMRDDLIALHQEATRQAREKFMRSLSS